MKQLAISIQNVSKKFRLFQSPKQRLLEALHPFNKKYHKEFWALQNINIQIQKGQTIGIVGRNGAGKSTLLQILCSILKPTSGSVQVDGRISALLALGAGFNPEFTGRQNILMNGTLLGFSSEEMKKRLPAIEAFADIGDFIDQPIKIYSSGMALRLAFAAAINVDPDILIVDEALAVGDAKFQHKCYGKFLEFQSLGKTIVFVTHNMDTVIKHCHSVILLENGGIIDSGDPQHICHCYLDLLFTGKISNYQYTPHLVQEGLKEYNIIHYKTKYYAVKQSVGSLDFSRLHSERLKEYIDNFQCLVASSLEEINQLIDQRESETHGSFEEKREDFILTQEGMVIETFLEDCPQEDKCVDRKTYNKNEYRFGDKRAQIVDYLILSNEKEIHGGIQSGTKVDIYMKVKFLKSIKHPLFGFSIKTIDGIIIYGSNTRLNNFSESSAESGELFVFKFSMKMDIQHGDFFVDLGIAEKQQNIDHPLDIRCGLIHLIVLPKQYMFDGLADFSCTFEEVKRLKENKLLKG